MDFGLSDEQKLLDDSLRRFLAERLPTTRVRDGGRWQFTYMFQLGLIIGGGTAQVQKNIIAERGLGMPREPTA